MWIVYGLLAAGLAYLINRVRENRNRAPLPVTPSPANKDNAFRMPEKMVSQEDLLKLDNNSDWPFELDGVMCRTMESLLQSLKFSFPEKQKEVLSMSAEDAIKEARACGVNDLWRESGCFYWMGKKYDKKDTGSIEFLYKAYFAKMMYPAENGDILFLILQKATELELNHHFAHYSYPDASIVYSKEQNRILLAMKNGQQIEDFISEKDFWSFPSFPD